MQVQIYSLVLLTWDCVTTLYALSILPSRSNTVDDRRGIVHSDDEIVFFWQAERRARWSIAQVLFMLVSLFG